MTRFVVAASGAFLLLTAVATAQPPTPTLTQTVNDFAKVIDELFLKQARATSPEERKKHLRAFEKRLIDEEVHTIYTLQWHRIIPHNAKVRGWTVTPSHYLNQQLDTVWLAQ